MDDLRIVADKARIRVRLIGRMADDSIVVGHISAHTEVHIVIHDLCFGPLLQLHDDNTILALFVGADNDEVYSLGCLGNVVFNRNLDLVVNLPVIHNIPHKLHGVMPGFEFAVLPCIKALLPNEIENLSSDDTRSHILDELSFISIVDNHNDYSSLYFLALPLAFSTGYFSALRCSFSSIISLMSRPYLSAI